MSKRKKILLMLTKGGLSQSKIAAVAHASKRDASTTATIGVVGFFTKWVFDIINPLNGAGTDLGYLRAILPFDKALYNLYDHLYKFFAHHPVFVFRNPYNGVDRLLFCAQ